MILQKGIFHQELHHIKTIPLIQLVKQNNLLPITIVLKLMYQLIIILNTINIEGNSLENLKMEDLYVSEFEELNKLDIFIQQKPIKENNQKNQDHLLNLLKDILIQFGLKPCEVYNFKQFEDIQIYILDKLQINLQNENWREMILQSIYGFEIKQTQCYNKETTYIFHIKVPYYIQSNQDHIIIKWIHQGEQQKRLIEVDNFKIMKKSNYSNWKQLYCYNLDIQNSTLLYLQKYSLTLTEYSKKSIININEKIKICSKLADELKKLHDNNKIHRDLKPENIMVTAKEIYTDKLYEITDQNINQIDSLQWSIIDFESTIEKGQTDDFMGTQLYIPPENMKDKSFDESYDIWQMGLCFLEFMTLQTPPYTKKKEKRIDLIQGLLNKLNNKENKNMYSNTMYNIISQMVNQDPNRRPKLEDVIKQLNYAILH